MQKCDNAAVGEKLTRYKSWVRGCIVIMDQPIARTPQFSSFLPKNTAVELGIHSLAFGGKFKAHNPSNVEKHNKHAVGHAAALPCLLQSCVSWALPL
jgi:hypothetical protein